MSLPKLRYGNVDFPCRALTMWIFGFALIFMVLTLWYVTQPVVVMTITNTETVAKNMSCNETEYNTALSVLKPIANYWGPLVVLGILAVCIISSQREDWRGSSRV